MGKTEKDLGLVYWDYYHADTRTYEKMLDIHAQLSDNVIFPGSNVRHFYYHVKESGVNTKSYYQNIQKCMKECAKTGKYQLLFSFYEKLAAVLADKADLGMCIKSAYRFIQEIRTILTEWFWFPFCCYKSVTTAL